MPAGGKEALDCGLDGHPPSFSPPPVGSPADGRSLTRLAELAVHGANVQPGQVVMVSAELGQEELARAVAAAGYDAGAKFVDVVYFDPRVKRARIEHADPETLEFVPDWYGERLLALAEGRGARITLAGPIAPNLLATSTRARRPRPAAVDQGDSARRRRPLDELVDRPLPHPAWAKLVHPELPADEASGGSGASSSTCCGSTSPTRGGLGRTDGGAGRRRRRLAERRFDAIELRGPGTELTVGMLPTHTGGRRDFSTADGLRHFPNLPTEEVFTTPDPERTRVTSPRPSRSCSATARSSAACACASRTASPSKIDADQNGEALESQLAIDEGASSSASWRSSTARAASAARHRLLRHAAGRERRQPHRARQRLPFLVEGDDVDRVNSSGTHIDFMIGSPRWTSTASRRTASACPCCAAATGRSECRSAWKGAAPDDRD